MMSAPLVSIISINFKKEVITCDMLDSLRHISYPNYEIIIVDNGAEKLQVVCGAPNARAGIKVPFAQVGAAFPELKIKKTKSLTTQVLQLLSKNKRLATGARQKCARSRKLF